MIPIVVGALWTVPKSQEKSLDEREISERNETIKPKHCEDRLKYLEEYWKPEETCYHSESSEIVTLWVGYMHIHEYTRVCVHPYMCACMYIYIYIYIRPRTCVRTHTHLHTHTHTHIHTYICGKMRYLVNVFICLFLDHILGFHYHWHGSSFKVPHFLDFYFQFLFILSYSLTHMLLYTDRKHVFSFIVLNHYIWSIALCCSVSLDRKVSENCCFLASVIGSGWCQYHFSESSIS